MTTRTRNLVLAILSLCSAASVAAQAQTAPAPAPATPPAQPASAAATPLVRGGVPRKPVTSRVITWESLKVTPTAIGAHRDLFNGPTATINNLEGHITTVNPGESAHPPHTHGTEEMLIVKEGTLEVTINGKVQLAPPGSIIFYTSNDPHGTRNVGTVPCTYYVFNWTTDKTPATIPISAQPPAPTAPATPAATPAATTPAAK